MDKIFIKNLVIYGILGIHPHEQNTPREIRVNVEVTTDISQAGQRDDITQTINYSTLAKEIRQFITQSHFLTIEKLIESLAKKILQNEQVQSVWLQIEKPNAVPGAESVGVAITRTRD